MVMQPLDPDFTFPHDPIKCGLRMDLPKKQRRHDWRDAGQDIRHQFSGFLTLADVKICVRCGADQDKEAK